MGLTVAIAFIQQIEIAKRRERFYDEKGRAVRQSRRIKLGQVGGVEMGWQRLAELRRSWSNILKV